LAKINPKAGDTQAHQRTKNKTKQNKKTRQQWTPGLQISLEEHKLQNSGLRIILHPKLVLNTRSWYFRI